MTDLLQMIKSYSTKYDKKIKGICAPLVDCLEIPVFTYYFLDADGTIGYLTNAVEFNEYYFGEKLYLDNPYFSHPSLFRSGHMMSTCTMDLETQKLLGKRFHADHFFLKLNVNPTRMEGFIFANEDVDAKGSLPYLNRLDLLDKFGRYFKREAKDLIGKLRADGFNIRKERGIETFEMPVKVALSNYDKNTQKFLKKVTGLSPQEQKCLNYFQQGKSAQATAAIMDISQRTVEYYFEMIKSKLGCTSKYDLLDY